MDTTTYLAAWLLAGLVAIGILSWMLARYKRRRDLRLRHVEHVAQVQQRTLPLR